METGAADPDKPPQGWFVDPFEVHEQRWYSQGSPTSLVRDGRTEAQDPAPDRRVSGLPQRATPASHTGLAEADRTPTDVRDGDIQAEHHFDVPGDPAARGTVGTPTTAARITSGMSMRTIRSDGVTLTPKRVIRTRWVALGFAVVWTLLLTGLLSTASTATHAANGRAHTQTVLHADPGGVVAFVALLVMAVVVTGLGFVRRLRTRSEVPSRAGYVFAGILGLLGVLSLASIGLALIILGAVLAVVARPLKRPRPLPGERVT